MGPLVVTADGRVKEALEATDGHCDDKEMGTHTPTPQQLSIKHNESEPHCPLAEQGVRPAHGVLPGTHRPPPSAIVPQTQSGLLLLHSMKVVQVAPVHPAFGLVHLLLVQVNPAGQH